MRTSGHVIVLFGLLLFAGCSSLPRRPRETAGAPIPGPEASSLGRAVAPAITAHRGLSGVYPLKNGSDAFAARMQLAGAAERTLDVQYYIWQRDDCGKLLANQLLVAADRGVHVRLLLDDMGANTSDIHLLALDSHPNIEVRLFNPVANRRFRGLSSIFEFGRVQRRMHNKTFTVDGQITILGGRNIGNEYFGFGSDFEFADLDVMAIGPVVRAASRAFDLYWRSDASIPIRSLDDSNANVKEMNAHRAGLAAQCEGLRNSAYLQAERDSLVMPELRQAGLVWFWGEARLVYDLPAKVTTESEDVGEFLMAQLRPIIDATQHEMIIVSPYFVPGKAGVAFFQTLRKRGVRVVIVTNSLAATDVTAVHAGYRRYRKALLRAGVELYEFKPTAPIKESGGNRNTSAGHGGSGGSSRASLHAKTFIFDGQKVFVGSLNLDPRSVALNTEIGAVFDIPVLARNAAREILGNHLQNCYRLELTPGSGATTGCSRITWIEEENGKRITYTSEPRATLGRRLLVALVALLPIESQL